MSRRARKLPVASAGDVPDIHISSADWEGIEKKYGAQLPGRIRAAIVRSMREYVYWEVFERTVAKAAEAERHLEQLIKAAEALYREFQPTAKSRRRRMSGGSQVKTSEATRFAWTLIKKHFWDTRLRDQRDPVGSLRGLLVSFGQACRKGLAELKRTKGFEEGESWAHWIRSLTRILRESGLETGVSKDGLRTSPFTALVWELQHFLPDDLSPHMTSRDALAKAIIEARRDK
jgi:hypothetical protein